MPRKPLHKAAGKKSRRALVIHGEPVIYPVKTAGGTTYYVIVGFSRNLVFHVFTLKAGGSGWNWVRPLSRDELHLHGFGSRTNAEDVLERLRALEALSA
jgi:hypothetical protein